MKIITICEEYFGCPVCDDSGDPLLKTYSTTFEFINDLIANKDFCFRSIYKVTADQQSTFLIGTIEDISKEHRLKSRQITIGQHSFEVIIDGHNSNRQVIMNAIDDLIKEVNE